MTKADKTATHLKIGVITRPHGVRGEVKVRVFFEESSALSEVSRLTLESPRGQAQNVEVSGLRGSAKGPILSLAGVVGRAAADELRGYTIWVPRASLPPLEPGQYYLVDLVGCEVRLDGQPYARVVGVRPDPSVDTMVVERVPGGQAEIPIVDAWIGEVNTDERWVELLSTDGVIES